MVIFPEMGSYRRMRSYRIVDFPLPLNPVRLKNSPGLTENDTLLRTDIGREG